MLNSKATANKERQLSTQHITLHAGRGLMQGNCHTFDRHMQSPCAANSAQAVWRLISKLLGASKDDHLSQG